ncbi:hypothetical protein ACJJTC_016979 [Scirpophaga incertulas]
MDIVVAPPTTAQAPKVSAQAPKAKKPSPCSAQPAPRQAIPPVIPRDDNHTSDDHRNVTKLLASISIPYHIYTRSEERKVRCVLRGVPVSVEVERVHQDLVAKGLPVTTVHQMHNRSGGLYPLLSSDFLREGEITVCGLSDIKLEMSHAKGPSQCRRCQLHGHEARLATQRTGKSASVPLNLGQSLPQSGLPFALHYLRQLYSQQPGGPAPKPNSNPSPKAKHQPATASPSNSH